MRLLLDTHTLIWWLEGSGWLSVQAQRAISDEENDVLISAASAWEITTKYRLGKLPSAEALARDVPGAIVSQGFAELPITMADAVRAGSVPGPHRDPVEVGTSRGRMSTFSIGRSTGCRTSARSTRNDCDDMV